MTMTEEHELGKAEEAHPIAHAELPIDADVVQKAIDKVTEARLDVPPREAIDQHTVDLTEHARRLLREDYPSVEQDNPGAIALFRALYQLLDRAQRPTPVTSDYTAWMYSRNLAGATHALLDLHRQYLVP
ncbi:hypothetical protein [Streptomyces lutosisoli]|uniref:Uncharacterized protein n=1 Tax=Streptomyces lutosisoli TaxID=2665721 RepID=A0ABW2VKC5_9ACTN